MSDIDENWEGAVIVHLRTIQQKLVAKHRTTAISPDYDRVYGEHLDACEALEDYLKENFGSTQGFSDFLKGRISVAHPDDGARAALTNCFRWSVSGGDLPARASEVYRVYQGYIERLTP